MYLQHFNKIVDHLTPYITAKLQQILLFLFIFSIVYKLALRLEYTTTYKFNHIFTMHFPLKNGYRGKTKQDYKTFKSF